MSTVSKSPRRVAAVALDIGRSTFPTYGHRFSRKDFTLPQLFACLVLRKFFNADYRGICEYLRDWPALREQLGLRKVPHYTTLQKKEAMLLRDARIERLLDESVSLVHRSESEPASSKKNAPLNSNSPPRTRRDSKRAARVVTSSSDATERPDAGRRRRTGVSARWGCSSTATRT